MLAGCNSVSDWRSSAKTVTFFGLERNQPATVKTVIHIHKSVFLAANGGLISSTSTHDFLLKIIWSLLHVNR